ncbi:MAG TPA: hypothetical protein VJ911_04285 [Cryomorphaceae bacterium]|nr:hypothetical protein [Cryomorphaceae bacterium]
MKQVFAITILTLLSINLFGQGCGLVSATKDKKTGIETKGGVVNSKDFYSLLIQKKLDPNDSLNYRLFLNAASRVMLSDSLLNSKGTFELFLTSGERIVIDNAECENDPLGFGASIGFTVMATEETLMQIIEHPIQKVKVFGILETEFSPRKQKQQQKIMTCLKNET